MRTSQISESNGDGALRLCLQCLGVKEDPADAWFTAKTRLHLVFCFRTISRLVPNVHKDENCESSLPEGIARPSATASENEDRSNNKDQEGP